MALVLTSECGLRPASLWLQQNGGGWKEGCSPALGLSYLSLFKRLSVLPRVRLIGKLHNSEK